MTTIWDISYIDKEVQEWIYEYISDTGFIKPKQIAALRNQLNDGPINQIQMLSIFNNCVIAKKVSRSLTFSEKKLTKYFPDDYTAKDMEQVIEEENVSLKHLIFWDLPSTVAKLEREVLCQRYRLQERSLS